MRYTRQEIYNKIGKKNQEHLGEVLVSVVGLGALGTNVCEMLVRSGIKNLIIIDRDIIELSNLQRQGLYTEGDVGKLKTTTANRRLKEIDCSTHIKPHCVDLNYENIDLIKSNLVIDCTDNLDTRFLINEYCTKNKIPWIYGSVAGSKGMSFNIIPGKACFKCVFKEPNSSVDNCTSEGILNTIVRVIAAIQVTEAVKILTKQKVREELICYDIWENKMNCIKVDKEENCSVCNGSFKYLSGRKVKSFIKMCGSDLFQIKSKPFDLNELNRRFKKLGEAILQDNCLFFKDFTVFKDGRVLVKARTEEEAKSLFNEYFY